MKEPDENVIIRFLTGCCSDQELEEVRDWINASEDNAAELFRLEEMYRRMSGLTMSGREVEKALTGVHTRIRRARAREVSMMRIIRYAAAALVLVMMSAGMWYLGGGMGKLGATDYIVAKASMNTPREVTLDDRYQFRLFEYTLPTDKSKKVKSVTFTSLKSGSYPTILGIAKKGFYVPTGIDSTETEGGVREISGIYTINGMKLNAPQRGINIIKYTDGTAKKVIIK